ncbi:MAG: hypothetical protein V3573_08945 [Desulfovibrionaceae bacterium]
MQTADNDISLRMVAEPRFIPLVQGVVEQGALAFGLERDKALRLTMAAEEIVSHLIEAGSAPAIDLTLSFGGWCVRADFSFTADPSDLWAMNLAAREDVGAGKSMEHLGLLLAARMTDGFSLRIDGRVVHLELRQDRVYPLVERGPGSRGTAKGDIRILDKPEPELIKAACARAASLYPPHLLHEALHRPGKVVDMAAHGDLHVLVAVDAAGELAGLMLWRSPSKDSVSFSGPYVFVDTPGVAEVLETGLLHTVARTSAVSLFSDFATGELSTRNFESLGRVGCCRSDAPTAEVDVWFRDLHEDTGTVVWSHPELGTFLHEQYDNLVLMRTIREVSEAGDHLPKRSVFSAALRPELKQARLSPMVVGEDAADAVARHVAMLREDGYCNIFFHLDLAYGWQAAMGGVLLASGFVPRLLLPHGGLSDVMVLQHV